MANPPVNALATAGFSGGGERIDGGTGLSMSGTYSEHKRNAGESGKAIVLGQVLLSMVRFGLKDLPGEQTRASNSFLQLLNNIMRKTDREFFRIFHCNCCSSASSSVHPIRL